MLSFTNACCATNCTSQHIHECILYRIVYNFTRFRCAWNCTPQNHFRYVMVCYHTCVSQKTRPRPKLFSTGQFHTWKLIIVNLHISVYINKELYSKCKIPFQLWTALFGMEIYLFSSKPRLLNLIFLNLIVRWPTGAAILRPPNTKYTQSIGACWEKLPKIVQITLLQFNYEFGNGNFSQYDLHNIFKIFMDGKNGYRRKLP